MWSMPTRGPVPSARVPRLVSKSRSAMSGDFTMGRQHNRAMKTIAALMGSVFLSAAVAAPSVTEVSGAPAGAKRVPAQVSGRVTATGQYQWPGLYFESRFGGRGIYFETGP